MIFDTEFEGGHAFGAVVQGVALAEPEYVAADGRALAREDYGRLSSRFLAGCLTGTVRSIATPPNEYAVAASPGFFVTATGTSVSTVTLQYSADGAAWSTTSVVTPSGVGVCPLWAGSRWVLAVSSNQAFVTTGDNPGSTWVATTGGATTPVPRYGLAYRPATGRVVQIAAAATATIYTLDTGSTAWASRTASNQTRVGVCDSGSKFITITSASPLISTSSNGETWADSLLPEALSAGQGGIASNGNGAVVVSGVASGLLYSPDHGATWGRVTIPGVSPVDTWKVRFSDDRFFVGTAAGVAMSFDGKAWFLEPQPIQAKVPACTFAKKGSVIVQVQASTTAYSFTESTTHFNAPLIPSASNVPNFIKAL